MAKPSGREAKRAFPYSDMSAGDITMPDQRAKRQHRASEARARAREQRVQQVTVPEQETTAPLPRTEIAEPRDASGALAIGMLGVVVVLLALLVIAIAMSL
jgi:ferric-dicitrate binding protein FerR (iron transport regulator)